MGTICPSCGFENIAGSDSCEECFTDLRHLDSDEISKHYDQFERAILTEEISTLSLSEAILIDELTTLEEAISILVKEHHGALLVSSKKASKDGNVSYGIFTGIDVLRKACNKSSLPLKEPVKNFMTAQAQSLDSNAKIVEALHIFNIGKFGFLPITSTNKPTVILGIKDILIYLLSKHPQLAEMQLKGEKTFIHQ